MAKTLRLTLKKEWFDLYVRGIKTEDYRDIKPYWIAKLCSTDSSEKITSFFTYHINETTRTTYEIMKFDEVEFTNGYGDHRPKITFECKEITTGEGNPEWGAEEGVTYFVIKVGKEISRANF